MVCFLTHKKMKEMNYEIVLPKNIKTRPVFNPIHLMPMYEGYESEFNSEDISQIINLPSYPSMKIEELDYVLNQ